MRYTRLGKSDLKISVIGLGTSQFGNKNWGWNTEYGVEEALAVINRAVELGVNFFDTAEVYGDGVSEKVLAKGLSNIDREDIVIATKVAGRNLRYKDVVKAAKNSLERLGTSYIDLYQIHWPNFYVPIKETIKAMEDLVDKGWVRYIGVSNFNGPLLREVIEACRKYEVISNQVLYNSIERMAEKEIIPLAKENGVAIIAYSPLAMGILTGKYNLQKKPSGWRRESYNLITNQMLYRNSIRFVELVDEEIAKKKSCSVSQIFLAWTISKNAIPIPGAKKPLHIELNAKASEISLSQNEINYIDNIWNKLLKEDIW
jgi:aryl-alcohol dehydrogenase-like predicted oxidoreductase